MVSFILLSQNGQLTTLMKREQLLLNSEGNMLYVDIQLEKRDALRVSYVPRPVLLEPSLLKLNLDPMAVGGPPGTILT